MDIVEVNKAIHELETGSTSFENCRKLADLYIVRDNYIDIDNVVREYGDILPQYHEFIRKKKKFQLGESTKEPVVYELNLLCKEIVEFVHILYSNSDMPEERQTLQKMIDSISIILK